MKLGLWIVAAVFSHRALYGAAAAGYGAAALGVDKAVVEAVLIAVYLALACRG